METSSWETKGDCASGAAEGKLAVDSLENQRRSLSRDDGEADLESANTKKSRKNAASLKDAVKSDDDHDASSSDESPKEGKKSDDEDTSSELEEAALSPDSSLRKAKPLLESVKKTLTAAAISAAQKTDDMSGIGSGKTIPKPVATGCTPSPNKSTASKGTPGASSAKATPTKATPNPAKGGSGSSSVPLVYKSPFLCSCGRNFDTKRGLSIHMSSNESHVPMDTAEVSLEQIEPKGSDREDQPDQEESGGAAKAVATSTPSTAASDTAATSPGSPTHFYLSKTSARNPHYYSIIRTRRTSGIEGEAAAPPAGKGSEGGEPPGVSAANPSPAKGGKSLGGKKPSQVGGQSGSTAMDADTQGSETKMKKKSRDSSEPKSQGITQQKSEEIKGSSASPSHQATKKPAAGSVSVAATGSTSGGSAALPSNLQQELALRNSPITRSNAASLKTPHEFISLPTRRKRGKKGSGPWRGSFKKEGSKQDSDDNMSEGVGEDFESPTEPPRSSLKDSVRSNARREAVKATSDETSASTAPTTSKSLDFSSDEASQQPKRKRGRPPKARSSAPSTPHGNEGGLKGSPSSSGGKSGSVTRSGKIQKRAQSSVAASGDAGEEFDSEPAEESPLPLKSKSLTASSVKGGCNLEVSRKGGDKGKADKESTTETESASSKQKKEGKAGTVPSTESTGKKESPGKGLLGKRAAGSGDRASLRPKKKHRKRKASVGSSRASKVKKEMEEDEGEEEMEEEEDEEEEMVMEKEDQAEAASEEDPEEEEEVEEEDKTLSKKRSGKKKQEDASSLALSKTRSKTKAVKTAPKSKSTPKPTKGKLRKKSQSEAEEADTDVSMETENKAVATEGKDDKQEEKNPDEAASTLPAAKIPVSQQRLSSVIVSVLSGPAEKPQQQQQQQQQPPSQNLQQTSDQTSKPPSSEGGAEQTNKDGTSSVSVTTEKEFRQPDQPQPPSAQMFYPTSSPTTPTYGPFPYPASFPPGPHHPIMYHPGAHPPPHPSGIYSPQFYSYPGSQPMQMPPHPNQFMPPQPPMNVAGHPGSQTSGNPEQQGASSPHAVQQGQQLQQSQQQQQQQHQQQQQQTTKQQQPATQQQPLPASPSFSQGPQNSPVPITSNVSLPPAATSVGGVRVSVMSDKSIPRAMVTLPYHMPSATPPRGPRPPSGPGGYPPMDISGMRPYIPGAGGPQSPEGMESHQHIHPPHPLQQVYRPPIMGGYHTPHLHPSAYGPMAIRMDHMAPYLDWPHEPRPPPAEESPAQPVKCPECNRTFKNNKALNGHMRLHGGFDWSKKHPYNNNSSNASGSSGGDGNKNNQSAAGGTGSSGNTSASSPNEDGKQSAGPSSAKSRKRSHSNSRSRSNSPTPGLVSKGRSSKRKKSSADDNVSGQSKEGSTRRSSSNGALEGSGAVSSAAAMEAVANLPVPREPSIFTFDSNTHIPSSSQKSLTSSSLSTQPSESAVLGGGGSGGLVHKGSTLDDLCRAAAELERMDTTGTERREENGRGDSVEAESGKRRPGNIVIPDTKSPSSAIDRDKYRHNTPPYTPPPILSPPRTMMQLSTAVGPGNPSTPCTPNNRILHPWNSRRSNDGRMASETEEITVSFSSPRINVGDLFQAELPDCDESRARVSDDYHGAMLVWKPFENMTPEDESVVEGYLELACSPSVGFGGRNKELAIHYLFALGGSIKEAVKWMLSGRSIFDSTNPMADYKYSGTVRWSGRERQQFRRAWKVHEKKFKLVKSSVESKKFPDVIDYYYRWKKYCSDDYRGRSRNISEEIFSDEDEIYAQIPSSSSSGSGDSSELGHSGHNDGNHSVKSRKRNGEKYYSYSSHGSGSNSNAMGGSNGYSNNHKSSTSAQSSSASMQNNRMSSQGNLPLVYAPHSSPVPVSQQVHQFPCKYPGCNQVFTSIFALNGHIRIHGGSFYPKASSQPPSQHFGSMSRASQIHSNSSSFNASTQIKLGAHQPIPKSLVEIELAKTLLELPGGGQSGSSPSSSTSSIAKGMRYHTPSPKPSPGKGKSSASKKKMASSSPGEREDCFPCNKCGRIFTKVKSRSAHMKSHIPKAT